MMDERGKLFQPRCLECGAVASRGFGVELRKGTMGYWYCFAHRHLGEKHLRPSARKTGDQEQTDEALKTTDASRRAKGDLGI